MVDGADRPLGIVTLGDLEQAILDPESVSPGHRDKGSLSRRVSEIMSTDLAIAYPDETLEEALRTMAQRGGGRLPVVEPGNPTRLVGLLRRSDLIEAFRQQEDPARSPMPILDIGAWGGTCFIELVIAADAPAANRAVRDLPPHSRQTP